MTIRQWVKNFNSDDFKKVFETNTYGIAHAIECLIPIMKKQGYGKIAGVTSLADVVGIYRGLSVLDLDYAGRCSTRKAAAKTSAASKAAATRLLESARVELKKLNIRVITVKPGFVKTPMTDKNEFIMPFMIKAEKAAKIIRKGIRKRKSIVQFTRGTVILTKLSEFAPNWLFDPALEPHLGSRIRPSTPLRGMMFR